MASDAAILRVASWNVHMFMDSSVEALSKEIIDSGADVVCMQESGFHPARSSHAGGAASGRRTCLSAISAATGLSYCASGVSSYGLGQSILSRHPIELAEWVRLDAAASITTERRAMVVAVVRVPTGCEAAETASGGSAASAGSSADDGLVSEGTCPEENATSDPHPFSAASSPPGSPLAGAPEPGMGGIDGAPAPVPAFRRALVACIHVDHLTENARRLQFRQASAALKAMAASGSAPLPHILCGDFNTSLAAEHPEAAWAQMHADRDGFLPLKSELLPLLTAPLGDAVPGVPEETGYGYHDSAWQSWAGLLKAAQDDDAASLATDGAKAGAVQAAARLVRASTAKAGAGASPPTLLRSPAAALAAVRGAVASARSPSHSWLQSGHWNGRTDTEATHSGVRLWRRHWIAPARLGLPAGAPLDSTCRFGTRIDFLLTHAGASPATPEAPAEGAARAATSGASTPGSPDASAALPAAPAVPAQTVRGAMPAPSSPKALAARLRRFASSLSVPQVVPGSHRVLRTRCSDHDIVRTDLVLM
ncbi:hypothetical protein FNF27_03608 [Cafeteria roenbergensis]|uniref:Endonuclease/exonuclease/phosphatase domain-containing protein n=1 Tax=Cafeteria roenbergensis TaxID=33653 RepID=A0A5A8EAG0_CAFRO|nr:hypothetical protein FNF27_03608 [Cafeteria roenbergensis]